jgi:uncharacterized membrane protein YhaH (DUF805 family)
MDWVWYLFSFEGRINRAKLWLAGLIVICWMLFLAMLMSGLVVLLGGHPHNIGFGIDYLLRIFDPTFYRSRSLAELPVLLFEAAGSVLFLWVYFATAVKRLHDRDKSAWWAIPLVAIPTLYNRFAKWLPDDSYLVLVVSMLALVFCIWGFVELYCLKGSRKTNRFGANPLLAAAPDPRVDRQGKSNSGSGWDQQSEIEMVPHKAGPPPVWHVKPGYE